MTWISPNSGRPLHHDTPHSLTDGQFERWPVVEGIPYLRTRSEGLVARALHELDSGAPDNALIALLTDQDEWWSGPATDLDELAQLVAKRDILSLRQAMELLRLGPVADYFAYRWSDPTYLAGLALLEAHWNAPSNAFELAAGIGHYARDLTRLGVECLCADVVFAKCWLAKNWVAPDAQYVVFDAGDDWPIGGRQFDLVHCQDAFYFLPEQDRVADRLRRAVAPDGVLAVGHLHNTKVEGGAMGPAKTGKEWQNLFPGAMVYDERMLLDAMMGSVTPMPTDFSDDPTLEAWSIVEGGGAPRRLDGGLTVPGKTAALRRNPLLNANGNADWPSAKYEREYASGCYFAMDDPPVPAPPERSRALVDLPERW